MDNKFIAIMTERIVRDFDPLQIILFGSQARGNADQHSDIDLLIVFEKLADKDKRKTAVDIRVTLADLPVAKDIVITTPEELEHHRTRIGAALCPTRRKDTLCKQLRSSQKRLTGCVMPRET